MMGLIPAGDRTLEIQMTSAECGSPQLSQMK